jgi:hypothetical protein
MKTQQMPTVCISENYIELSRYEVSAAGRINIMSSGGTSASEGGMGSGSKSSEEKGTVSGPDQKNNTKGNTKSDNSSENSFDPIKEDIEKAEQKNKSED